jgi:hypothetical protein
MINLRAYCLGAFSCTHGTASFRGCCYAEVVPCQFTWLSVAGILQLQLPEKQVKRALQAQWDKGLADGQQAAAVLSPRHSNCPGDQILLCTYVSGVRARDCLCVLCT